MNEAGKHLLYPKQINSTAKTSTEKTPPEESKIEENESALTEIGRTLVASIVFFVFFIFLGTTGIIIGDYYNQNHSQTNQTNTEYFDASLRNQMRTDQLREVKTALNSYYSRYYIYPEANKLENNLNTEGLISKIDEDPINKSPFKYVYAVYDNSIGNRQTYILSASLEDKNGNATLWTIGSPTIDHRDFRDTSKANIAYIPTEEMKSGPKVKIKRK